MPDTFHEVHRVISAMMHDYVVMGIGVELVSRSEVDCGDCLSNSVDIATIDIATVPRRPEGGVQLLMMATYSATVYAYQDEIAVILFVTIREAVGSIWVVKMNRGMKSL